METSTTQSTTADIEKSLLEQAEAVDSGAEIPSQPEGAQESAQDRAGAETENAPDEPQAEKPAEAPRENESKEQGPASPETRGEAKQHQTESEYARARKEQERRDRSWKKLEQDKEVFRAEREKFDHERKKISASASMRDTEGYSAEDYENAARDFDARGESDLSTRARDRARQLQAEEYQRTAESRQSEFRETWERTVADAMEEDESLRDLNTPLARRVAEVLRAEPAFSMVPDGFNKAVAYARAQTQAALVPGLEEENHRLTTEIQRLNKLTSLNGSGPADQPKNKFLSEMTDREAEANLLSAASEADRPN